MSGAGGMGAAPFIPSERSGISVSPVNQAMTQKLTPKPTFRKGTKSKTMDIPGGMQNPIPSATNADTFSVLSQLQQQSHLEIIPQNKGAHSKTMDFTKNLPLSLSVMSQKPIESIRPSGMDAIPVYDIPRKINNPTKKVDKTPKDSVEIITLDD